MKKNQTAVIAALSIVLVVVVVMLVLEKGKNPSSSRARSSGDAQTYQLSALETRHGLAFPNANAQLREEDVTLLTLDQERFRFLYPPSPSADRDHAIVMSGDIKWDSQNSKNATFEVKEIAWSGYSAAKTLAETREFMSSLTQYEQSVLANEHQVSVSKDGVLGKLKVRIAKHDDGALTLEFLSSESGNLRFPGEQMMELYYLNRWETYLPVSVDPGDSD